MADIAQLGFAIDSSQAASAARNLDQMTDAAKRAETGTEKMARQINKEVAEVNKQISAATGFIKGFVAALASIQTVRALAGMADTWSDLTSRVRLSIGAHEDAADVMGRLSVIARQTYSSFEQTADAFARNSVTLRALGKSTAEQLDYTQALNNALVVSGAKGQQAELVMNGLSRAMAEGTMKGQELNLILNYGSRVAELLADELGVNITQLRGLAAEGKITGSVIFDSLVKNMEAVTKEAESMPETIGDAFVLIRNAVLQSVGAFDQANGLSESFAKRLIVIADNMEKVLRAAGYLAAFLAARFLAGAIIPVIAGLRSMVSALAATQTAIAALSVVIRATPIGALTTAIGLATAAYIAFRNSTDDVGLAAKETDRILKTLREEYKQNKGAAIDAAMASRELAKQRLAEAEATLAAAEAELEHRFAYAQATAGSPRGDLAALDGLRIIANLDEARGRVAGLREEFERLSGGISDIQFGNVVGGFDSTSAAAEALTEIIDDMTDNIRKQAEEVAKDSEAWLDLEQVMRDMESAAQDADRWLADLLTRNKDLAEQLAGVSASQRQFNREMEQVDSIVARLVGSYDALDPAQQAVVDGIRAQIEESMRLRNELEDQDEAQRALQESAAEVEHILSQFDDIGFSRLISDIETIQRELERVADSASDAFDPARSVELQRAISLMNAELQVNMLSSYRALIGAAQAFTKEGSSGFKTMETGMAALSIAQDIIALKAGVTAVLTQGQGDPYSAWARMAAMAAAVSPYLASIGQTLASFGGSGGGGGGAAQQQATQGTGSVLGDAEAKSESILRATEITADATQTLVGLNRGMLRSLQALEASIGSASGMLARGAGSVDFGPAGAARLDAGSRFAINVTNAVTGGILGGLTESVTRSILGARSRVSDIGILIAGGVITDLINGMEIGAYQQTQSRSWWGGSTRTREQVEQLDDGVARQFELIIGNIVETVRQGALALGLSAEDIEAAIESFRVEEIRISLMDLSAEEQQAELMAVFGSIFDGLAGHVVPFIEQFQQVGEGLGETLVRVATSVQVMQESMRYLGLAIDETDPETFAQISVGLVDLMGGIEEFASGMLNFFDKFAPEAHKFEVAQTTLTNALEQYGLAVPETRDAMWELMQSLDATTEAGREQIAILLELADTADAYYTSLERQADEMERAAAAADELNSYLSSLARDGWSGPMQQIMRLDQQYREHVNTIQELARASGRAEASEAELAIARNWHTRQLIALSAQIMESAMGLAAQLGYVQSFAANDASFEVGAIRDVGRAMEDRYARELQLLQQLDQYVRSLGISSVSPLNPTERLNEAQSEYERILALAQAGDLDALAQLQGAAQAYLQEAQGYFGGVGDYEDIFNSVRDTLRGLVDAGPQSEQLGPQTPVFGGPVAVTPGEGWAQQNAIERAILAQQLVDHLAALSVALNEPILELMEMLGIPITQLAEDLGITIDNITAAAVEAMAQLAYDLGLPLGELVTALGLELPDLADGVRELAEELGINLGELTGETAFQLAGLARDLRTDLDVLTTALGIDLGRLTDVNSPIYQALEQTIDALSPDIRDQLEPYLDDIVDATNEADANDAIAAAEAAINAMPVAIRNQLAPFFEGVDPVGSITELDYLREIDIGVDLVIAAIGTSNGHLLDLLRNIREQNDNLGISSYEVGTPFVPKTGPAILHRGEMVIPASVADRIRGGSYALSANDSRDSSELSASVDELKQAVERLRSELVPAARQTANNTGIVADEARRPKSPNARAA